MSDPDRARFAQLISRAYATALRTGVAPPGVRGIVSESWRRSIQAGVDPARPAPKILDARATAKRLQKHAIAPILPGIARLLSEELIGTRHFAAFSDADGVLLWTDGPLQALRTAVAPGFLPGASCNEAHVGTNAIGTALVLDKPVQILSAEHFNRLLHGWECAAAPVHDQCSGKVLGVIDLSGEFRMSAQHTLALTGAVASAAEAWLLATRLHEERQLIETYRKMRDGRTPRFTAVIARSGRVVLSDPNDWLGRQVDLPERAERWEHPNGTTVELEPIQDGYIAWRSGSPRPHRPTVRLNLSVLGHERATGRLNGRPIVLTLRHSEIVALLSLNPNGMTVRHLALALYGSERHASSVRAEITRLRPLLGDALSSRPYQLHPRTTIDAAVLRRRLDKQLPIVVEHHYPGPLLPGSVAPGIMAARTSLEDAIALGVGAHQRSLNAACSEDSRPHAFRSTVNEPQA